MTKRTPKWKKEKWELKLDGFLHRLWRNTRIGNKFMMNWYFFYQHKDAGQRALHIFAVIAVDLIILRVFGLI